jgi:hypothetical protein
LAAIFSFETGSIAKLTEKHDSLHLDV